MTIPAYPLAWPPGWPRHEGARKGGNFETRFQVFNAERQMNESKTRDVTVPDGVLRVTRELKIMGLDSDDIVISTNVPLRLDGMPKGGVPEPADPGVAVYWRTKDDARKVMAIDRYSRVGDNLAAVGNTLEALRGIARWGGGQILDRAFSGFAALPAPGQTTVRGWREVLEVSPTETDLETVKASYRRLSSIHHPDRKTGDADKMAALNWAWAQAVDSLIAAPA